MKIHLFSTAGLLSLLVLSASISVAPAQQPPGPGSVVKQQLPPGKDPGTFAFRYMGRVRFTQEPAFPVTVAITSADHKPVYKITVKDDAPFTISADLPQGSYWVESSLTPENDKIYWEAIGPQFFITPSGEMTNSQALPGAELLHQKMMTVVDPAPLKPIATTTEKRPLIKWQGLPGAVRYQVYWLVEEAPLKIVGRGTGETKETEFRLTADVIPNRRYELSVNAYGSDGAQLGYYSAAYFYTPGGEESFAKNPPPKSPTKGMPYLGIIPLKFEGSEGITVHSVRGDSPAMKAGLQPEDIIVTFNGKSLATANEGDFLVMVRSLSIGAKVPVEYLRNTEKKSTEITIEALP